MPRAESPRFLTRAIPTISIFKTPCTAGAGLCREEAVRLIVEQGPGRVKELFELGVHFTQNASGQFDLGREGGHRHNRIVHVKDHTGRDVEQALLERCAVTTRISPFMNITWRSN